MTKKEYLSQAHHIDCRINAKISQVSSLHDLATKASVTISDMPGSPTRNTHQMENVIVKIIDLEGQINTEIDRLVDLKAEIGYVINAVEDTDLRTLLELRYLSFKTWETIACEMGYELRWIYKLHKRALDAVNIPENPK